MGKTCLNCGKPLGSHTTLCHGCEADGVDPASITDVEETVLERLERYFIVSSTKCADCDDLHGTVTIDGESYTAADFGIESLEEWSLEMDAEEDWMRANRETVRAALPRLEDDWPRSVAAVRQHVL
ncbi:hypothetical protein GS429_06120 [Natronorubrum sp. JWXQ-INN-674]|uniref:Uncharacterized protein n=1 Tax=Natronorubrum halalkaliphilum TaxID=2691917 RepID=A0A6B0VKJ5_9EURY|nr:hypothetical protein [Natronorubrum halalkaliphilum]MXV61645.1 hypothetical protein [Natronorubrum halalkaliphilum]